MLHRNLLDCVNDLEKNGQLRRVDLEVDPKFELGVIQRLAWQKGSPALLFSRVKGTRFPMLANLFGSSERIRFIFRSTLRGLEGLLKLKLDPGDFMRRPLSYLSVPKAAWATRPKFVRSGPILANQSKISALPQLVSWPKDGGAYVTLPQVYTESPSRPGVGASNLGMYRVQLSGGSLEHDQEVGLHYQIHRGIGYHHAEAIERGQALPVNIFVGGPPALTLAAIMPLPEGMSELLFAGALGGRRLELIKGGQVGSDGSLISHLPMPAEADFCLSGYIEPNLLKPEGPFGDHLGYYSLAHDFPVMKVRKVWHRDNAIWPFTTVGRPPQEDTIFGEFIHDLTKELLPQVFSGISEVHAVDVAGVHPLLLAVGNERYVPFAKDRQPQELLTCCLSLLGTTQTSLSKYVIMSARQDAPQLSAHNVPEFFRHVLERTDFSRDLHFITRTTMDTLDYTGISLNQGSKLFWAVAGEKKRELCRELPQLSLPDAFSGLRLFAPGIAVLSAPPHTLPRDEQDAALASLLEALSTQNEARKISLLALCDDAEFCAANWDNFLWVVFTRSDPATDIYGAKEYVHCKHWSCQAPLVIDARKKSFHAPELSMNPEVEKRVEALGAKGGPLYGLI